MSAENGKIHLTCPVAELAPRMAHAMERSESTRGILLDVTKKVEQLDELPRLTQAVEKLTTGVNITNRNNTILLSVIAAALIVLVFSFSSVNLKASLFGSNVEIQQRDNGN